MTRQGGASGRRQVELLPGEELRLALDPEGGVSHHPPNSSQALLLTDLRVIHVGVKEGQRVVAIAPLSHVCAAEVRDRQRRPGRFLVGGILTGIGILVAAVAWAVLDVPQLALVVGGIPAVVGIYFLLAFFLSEDDGSLVLHTPGHTISFPLRSRQAADDAYRAVEILWDMSSGGPPRVTAPDEGVTETATPEAQAAPEAPPGEGPSPEEEPPQEPPPGVFQERRELLEKLETARSQLLELVQGLSEERGAHVPEEGEWSVKQNLSHVAEVEQRFVADALRARREEMPEVGPPEGGQWTRGQDTANERPLADLLEDLAQVRRDSLAAIETIAEEELYRKMRHREFGELSVLQLLRAIYRHDRMHVEQVAGVLAAVGDATG